MAPHRLDDLRSSELGHNQGLGMSGRRRGALYWRRVSIYISRRLGTCVTERSSGPDSWARRSILLIVRANISILRIIRRDGRGSVLRAACRELVGGPCSSRAGERQPAALSLRGKRGPPLRWHASRDVGEAVCRAKTLGNHLRAGDAVAPRL